MIGDILVNRKINNNLIVFESNPDFSDNSRGFWEYIAKNTNYETFWVIKEPKMLDSLKKSNINCGLINTSDTNEMIAQAKVLITSSFEFAYLKSNQQIHIAAWHGFPLKLIGFFDSASTSNNQEAFKNLKVITTQSDLITATSRLSRLTISGMFAVDPRKVKETGFPRNDLIFNYNGKEELKKITNIDIQNSKLILYLPTMRKGLKDEGVQFDNNIFNYYDYAPDKIDEFLERQNTYIFAKLHFADNEYYTKGNFKLPKRVIFFDTDILNSHLLTIYHIMNAFDILITDYSSVYVDYLLLNKPIIFSCPDLLKYKEDRGFVVDDPEDLMPGVIVKNQEGLIEKIEEIFQGKDDFSNIRNEKMGLFHSHIDGNSSKRLFAEMNNLLENNIKDSGKEVGKYFFPNVSPLYQYTLNATAEFYFDFGDGFTEQAKVTKDYEVTNEIISFEIDIPKGAKNIRFDPDEIGKWILKDFKVQLDHETVPYTVIVGREVDDAIYLTQYDPQILINLNDKYYQTIKISFYCLDMYANISIVMDEVNKLDKQLNDTKNTLIEAKNRISFMENSRSWKITKPLRDASEIVKRIKNHKK